MAQSSLVTEKARWLRKAVQELQDALDTSTGHAHDGTDSASVSATVTLDQAYDSGGAGVGRTINATDGAVVIQNTEADTTNVLEISKSPSGAAAGAGILVTMGANATGAGVSFANSGSGNDVLGTSSLWSVSAAGAGLFATVDLNGAADALILDADADTTISAPTDDQIDFEVNSADVFRLTATQVQVLAGATAGLSVNTGGVTITAGGLTVSAGGATVTGDSTITGGLTVTGSLTFGGNWTVGATLTVDELILDTDGSAPAATNCYLVRDNAGDLTANAITGKQTIIAIAGTDEYTFSATILDMLDNALDNVGYVILNAATAPAGTEVYAVNDNTGDLTLNALAGKDVIIAIAGTDEVKFDDAAHVFNDGSNDRDFRVETNSLQYAIYSDGGKDCIVLGDNTDVSSADAMVVIGNVAKTASNNASTAILKVVATASFTGQGTNAVMASLWVDEPNLTAGGATITDAASVYISGEPTEGGTGNYGLMVAASIGLIADAKDLVIGAGRDVQIRWSTADADNHALAIGLGATNAALHLANAGDIATDWNVAADADPNLFIHSDTTPATDYVQIYHDATDAHLNAAGGNWKFEVGGTAELTLAANALNLVDSVLYGSTASHTADTADGSLYLHSTSHATKGFVVVPNSHLGLIIGSDGSVDRATTVGTNALHLFNGTAPAGTLANGVSIYSEGGECKVLDALGNSTTLSPHTDDGDYVIHSYSAAKDETVTIHVEKLLKALANTPALQRFVKVAPGHVKRPVAVI